MSTVTYPFIRLEKKKKEPILHVPCITHTQCFQSLNQASKQTSKVLPRHLTTTLLTPLPSLELHDRIPQEPHVPHQPHLRGLGPSQMLPAGPLLVVAAACGRVFLACFSRSSSSRTQLRLPRLHRPLQHAVHAGQHLLRRLGEGQIRGADVVGRHPRPGPAQGRPRGVHGLAEPGDGQRGEHVARAAEEAVQGGHVDAEETRGAVGAGGRADHGEGGRGRGRCRGGRGQGERGELHGGDDDVRDVVGLVDGGDGFGEGGEGGDFDAGEESGVLSGVLSGWWNDCL
ncbi:hypothetical protein VTN02DRAFT_4653 [Thermoascus thermophilus]